MLHLLKASQSARLRGIHGGSKFRLGWSAPEGRFAGAGAELKFHDVDLDDVNIDSSGTITDSVVKIQQGTGEVARIGRKCTVRSIGWKFNIVLNNQTSSASAFDVVRVIMYIDKQCNGATAGVTDILESTDFESFNNLSNKSRFRTLMDRVYEVNSTSGGGDGTTEDYAGHIIHDAFYKKVNIPIEYNSTAGAIGEIRSNNIGVLLISRGSKCVFGSKIRIRFSDS